MGTLGFVSVDVAKIEEKLVSDKPQRGSRTPAVWVKFPNGKEVVLRVLPPYTSEGPYAFLPFLKIAQHWDVGPDGKRVICPNKMSDGKEPCYICDQVAALYKTGDKNDAARAQRMRAGQGFIYQVIDRDDPVWVVADKEVVENPELLGRPKIKFMRLPYAAHSDLLNFYNDPDYGDISHHETGIDLKIRRSGEGLDTTYNVKTKRENTPLFGEKGDPDLESMRMVLEDLYKLNEHPFFRVASYDETVAIFLGNELPKRENAAISSSQGSAAAGYISAPEVSLTGWIKEATSVWVDGKAGVPRTREETATAFGIAASQIANCYSEDADHLNHGCQNCPIHVPCACSYYGKYKRWSENAPAVEANEPQMKGGIIGRPSAHGPASAPKVMDFSPDTSPAVDSASRDDDVAAIEEYLLGDKG